MLRLRGNKITKSKIYQNFAGQLRMGTPPPRGNKWLRMGTPSQRPRPALTYEIQPRSRCPGVDHSHPRSVFFDKNTVPHARRSLTSSGYCLSRSPWASPTSLGGMTSGRRGTLGRTGLFLRRRREMRGLGAQQDAQTCVRTPCHGAYCSSSSRCREVKPVALKAASESSFRRRS